MFEEFYKMQEELIEMQEIINYLMEKSNHLSQTTMLSGFMMLMEEYCKANKMDMVETFEELNTVCKSVNEELGAYV